MKLFFITLFALCSLAVVAQQSETIERVNAVKFPKTGILTVKFDNNIQEKFQCEASPLLPLQDIPKYFSYPTKNTNLSFQAHFVNPLKFKLTLKSRYAEDPNVKVESEFFSTLAASLPQTQPFALVPAAPVPGLGYSVLMPAWFDLLQGQPTFAAANTTPLLQKLELIENFVAGKFTIGSNTEDFQTHLTKSINDLESAASALVFETKRNEADAIRKHIETFKSDLPGLVNDVSTAMMNIPGLNYTPAFTLATEKTIARLRMEILEFTRGKFAVFENYKLMLDEIGKVILNDPYIKLTNPSVKLKAKQDLIITITAIPLTIDKSSFTIKEGQKSEIEFYVILSRPQVEVSAGGAWITKPVVFNSYSATADSTSFKISNTETIKSFLPVMFLNFYTRGRNDGKNSTSENIWILPQIGVGTGKEYPTVLLGAGYVIPNRFIISGGLLNAWTQTLKSGYVLHSKITEQESKDISNVYEFKWVPRVYLSLQFKL